MIRSPLVALVCLSSVACAVVGCSGGSNSSSVPKTYPVTGKVLYKSGEPFAGGMVDFRAIDPSQAKWTCNGIIQPDGSFTLRTLVDNERIDGAVEGDHQVTVAPPGTDQSVQPIEYAKRCKVSAGGKNHFVITLDVVKRNR